MARTLTLFDLLFDDGTEKVVALTPRATVESERKFKGAGGYEATCYAAWISCGKTGGNFEHWLSSLADIETRVEDAPDPLAPEPPADQ